MFSTIWFKVLKYKKTFKKLFTTRHVLYENWPNVDLWTMLWTTEVLINKLINEQRPGVVYFHHTAGAGSC